ncbi:MAG: ParB/RepB/Spo0J family partition protein [Acetobacteraceae bacterium]|nr:ParB/RepB/Spo0J family partition protein [Acetobacteraceae bacterium]
MAQGNKGFASLVNTTGEGVPEPRRPPRAGILGARDNRLAELASGGLTTRLHEAVDPAVCRIWAGHNRDYTALNETVCADLISSLRAQGRQEVPAIVRRVTDDPAYGFEVICGARRHWCVTWLRAHDYPDFKFIVEPRELTDEEAFRLADLENRSRKDLSDYERAVDYARAIERYYEGNQQRMADRLQVSKSWLSRYLELARLPPEVLAAFASPNAIGISHAAALAPLLGAPQNRARVLGSATELAAEQTEKRQAGAPLLPPAAVLARLVGTARRGKRQTGREQEFRDADGKVFLKVRQEARRKIVFTLIASAKLDRRAVTNAVDGALDELLATDDHGTPRRRSARPPS